METCLPIKNIPTYDLKKIQKGNWIPYTTLYLGNYISGDFNENVGSHCGVDISTSQYSEQPDCLAIAKGKVIKVSEKTTGFGKHVVIKHENVPDFDDESVKTNLYSCYNHLSEICVKEGDDVKCGQSIGKTGNSGDSTAAHLHFQIDKENESHPFWPFTSKEVADAGLNFHEALNKGLNLDKAKAFTIHPMLYIQKYLDGKEDEETDIKETNEVKENKTEKEETNESKDINTKENKDISEKGEKIDKDVKKESKLEEEEEEEEEENKTENTSIIFSDIPLDHKYYESTKYLSLNKIIGGYKDGSFGPNDDITRAQILKIILLAFNVQLESDLSQIPFTDIKSSDWYTPYIMTAFKKGYAKGYEDSTFQPEKTVNRAEAFKFICGVSGLKSKDINNITFNDVLKGVWFEEYACVAQENNLLDFEKDNFEGDKILSRGETAEIIYRILKKI